MWEERRGGGARFSHEAVEELHQWLMQSPDYPAVPPPPHDRESRAQNLSTPLGGGGFRQSRGRAIRGFRGTFESNERARRNSNSSIS